MRITPLDVRKQEFKRGMRGFDCDEVRAFLTTLADEYEAVLVDNKQLRERVLEQDEKLAEYRNLEQTLRDTLMTAERVSQEARDNARKEGELLLQEARQRVERVLAEGREHLNELRREALAVHREKEAYLGRFRSLAEAQVHFVEQHRSDFKELDGRLLEQADAVPTRPVPAVDGDVTDESRPTPRTSTRDEWREYAIENEDDDGEVEHIAEVVRKAEQDAVVEPDATPAPIAPQVEETPRT